MNNISEQLLSAIDIVADEKISKLLYDKTIQAEIYSIVNLDNGEYKVKYSGNIFSVFASDITKLYSVGDSVYVNIPEGNFSKKKMITSLVSEQSLSYSLMMALQLTISEVSPTFDTMYNFNPEESYGIVAGASSEEDKGFVYIFGDANKKYSKDDYHGLFLQYANNYELIRILASFLVNFYTEYDKGNYGLEIEFFTKGENVISYRLDFSSFNGNPYNYSVYSPQSIVVKVLKNYLLGVKSIKFFQEDFNYDIHEYELKGEKKSETIKTPNIFCKDIQIQYVEEKDLTDTSYYLMISTPQGNSFTSNVNSIDLVGLLIYNGESIMNTSTCECQWYKRDLSIMVGDDKYNKDAGFSWIPIESNFNTLSLTTSAVPYLTEYKLITTYNSSVILSATIIVYNLKSLYDISIKLETIGDDIQLLLINSANDEVLIGDWYLSYPDNSYSSVVNGLGQTKISINQEDYLLYTSVVFYCEVYSYDKTQKIGVLEYTMSNSESQDDIEISYDGDDSFRYDSNGDITIEDSEKERTLLVKLAWKDGIATSYDIQWLAPDGLIIPTSKSKGINPTESMIENLWIDNSNILHYNIKLKYKVNYQNNTIKVNIITIDEKVYTFSKEILFLKDGDLGTNGTTYIGAIRPCDSNEVKISGLCPLIYNNGWKNSLKLKCYVYKDGILLNGTVDNSNYTISYEWTGINLKLSNEKTKVITAIGSTAISADSNSADIEFFVKVKISILDKMNDESTLIYASYPIDVAVGEIETSKINIDDIPSYIKYTSSGINPSFYSNDINFIYDNINLSNKISSLNKTILDIEEETNNDITLYYLKPASSFIYEKVNDDDSNIGILKCEYTENAYLLHPIVMYLDTYGNEAINGWDGTLLDIDGNGNYVFAPQVGAGEKDSSNRFTGVVMGKDSGLKLIGLYGYSKGVNTFGLLKDGTAFFGAKSGGGLINIDGTSATISGGYGGDNENGMTIILAKDKKDSSAIKLGAGNFEVKYDGTMYAVSGKIGGLTSSSNGWTIEEGRMYSGKSATWIELNSYEPVNITTNTTGDKLVNDTATNNKDFAIFIGSKTASNAPFSISKSGSIKAKKGSIGGWTLADNYLIADSQKVGMMASGTYRFWAGATYNTTSKTLDTSGTSYFYVNSSGLLYCKNATVNGTITATGGKIGSWNITSGGALYAGNTYLNADGSFSCDNASITGNITATTLTCNNGTIGGWTISANGINKGNTTLDSNGNIKTYSVSILSGGTSIGTLGCYTGTGADGGTTYNIGIAGSNANTSVVLYSGRNIKLNTSGSILLEGSYLTCSVSKDNLSGIYARFG